MLSFSHAVFNPAEESEQRLVLYSPLPENETAEKLARLMSGKVEPAAPRARQGRRPRPASSSRPPDALAQAAGRAERVPAGSAAVSSRGAA